MRPGNRGRQRSEDAAAAARPADAAVGERSRWGQTMTRGQLGPLAVVATAVVTLLAACGADPTATPASTPTVALPSEAAATPTPDAAALFQAEWDTLIGAAQDEGELTLVFNTGAGRHFRAMVGIFEEKFGVKVVVSTGSGSAQANRVLAEREAGQYLVDVMYAGATTGTTRMVPANALEPIANLFIHPEVTDVSLWLGGRHWYADVEQRFVFSYAAKAGPMNQSMRYNTELVTLEDIDNFNSVFDYLDPKWNGKIVSLVPGEGGGGLWHTAYVHPDIGPAWIDGFVSPELDVTFAKDLRFITDGVAQGKFAMGIGIGAAAGNLDALGDLGLPTAKLVKEFKEGGVLTGNQSNFMVPTNQPHPAVAKLWVNWFLSKEGQTLTHTVEGEGTPEPSLREDLTEFDRTREYERRVPGQDYYFISSDPEFAARRSESFEYARQAYESTR